MALDKASFAPFAVAAGRSSLGLAQLEQLSSLEGLGLPELSPVAPFLLVPRDARAAWSRCHCVAFPVIALEQARAQAIKEPRWWPRQLGVSFEVVHKGVELLVEFFLRLFQVGCDLLHVFTVASPFGLALS